MPLRGCNCGGGFACEQGRDQCALLVGEWRRCHDQCSDVVVQGFLLWSVSMQKTPRPGGVRGVGMKAGLSYTCSKSSSHLAISDSRQYGRLPIFTGWIM